MALLATDPVCLLVDDDGDVVVPMRFASGVQAVKQGIRTRILMVKGEWFLDLDFGVPYYQDLLGKKFDEGRAKNAFRPLILSTPGVQEITQLNCAFNRGTRVLSVSWRVRCEFGGTVVDELDLEAA